ncbi:uncharacterized protein EDB91DRAFT_1103904 [Suillus paluster]|uniref:uncharacterized protein n=1 Tax=Suillus paluster TaxID=48578 RepID=UPI001B87FA6B|nr:uncharacterized protein EDB91DRAFT_1103904 [Suillus paluster]KAG1752697.1 hypothetical protein EDB91DRAFT_1103904 [Suillus paluster]
MRSPLDLVPGHPSHIQLDAPLLQPRIGVFTCPEYPPTSIPHYVLCFAALVLLQGLMVRFPTARGSSGHPSFICHARLQDAVLVSPLSARTVLTLSFSRLITCFFS